MSDDPLLPDYSGACISNVVPALLEPSVDPVPWIPAEVQEAARVVLLVLDGLGWDQLVERASLALTLCSMKGGPISSVVPTTTATALTSIATGLTPGQHGVIGYRIAVEGDVLNVLRWTTPSGDARDTIPPTEFQKAAAFGAQHPPIVTRAEFTGGGFSGAHLDGTRIHGYRCLSTLVTEVKRLTNANEPFVYAYYDGIDKVAHEYGLGEFYDAELLDCDRLVGEILDVLPSETALVITADHGQVHTGDALYELPASVTEHVAMQSGEGRFRWLHARPGRAKALYEATLEAFHDLAWVRTKEQVIDEGWFGPTITSVAASRLGDVALVATGVHAFIDPADTGPYRLIGRHGSLTSAEMRVPLLAAVR
ncbi:MAG TPA: alkaline phosphatase family protein [Acidimicrobiales bacterium]